MMLGLLQCWFKDLISVLLKLLGEQSPPQPDSAYTGVEVGGDQQAVKGGIKNVVRDNEVAQWPNCNAGVRIGGNQTAVEGINNDVRGNGIRAPSATIRVSYPK